MGLVEKIQTVNSLKAQIDNHGALSKEVKKKIDYKFRLEWNYTSNSMEGNTLTMDETRSVMVGNITVDGKPIKDVLEMKGHDAIISDILKIGKGELNISESRIKDIHKGIIHEDNPEEKKKIGAWKTTNNYIINYKGERIDFTEAVEVPDKMHQLINWLNAEKEKINKGSKDAIHPIHLAFKFHLDYITIHPFFDGNGRTARILTNLILISYGYPPVYIKEAERKAYYQYLADIQGYGGSPDLFYEFMADRLIRSMQLVLDAIEGKEIEEEDDVWKDLELLKKGIEAEEILTVSPILIYNKFNQAKSNLIPDVIDTIKKFGSFFSDKKENHHVNYGDEQYEEKRKHIFENPMIRIESDKPKDKTIFGYNIYETTIDHLDWTFNLYGLKNAKKKTEFSIEVKLEFNNANYHINCTVDYKKIISVSKKYSESIDENISVIFCRELAKTLVEKIKGALEIE